MHSNFMLALAVMSIVYFLMVPISFSGEEFIKAQCIPVEIQAKPKNEKKLSKNICLTVVGPKTEINIENHEVIDAQDATVQSSFVDNATDADLIVVSKARAWIQETGEAIPITQVNRRKVQHDDTHTVFEIKYSTQKGTSIIVYIIESQDINADAQIFHKEENTYFFPQSTLRYQRVIIVVGYLFFQVLLIIIIYIFVKSEEKKVENLVYQKKITKKKI